jgi:hypothetical protein
LRVSSQTLGFSLFISSLIVEPPPDYGECRNARQRFAFVGATA